MDSSSQSCHICSAGADWVRMRMPNARQMNYLCDRHYQALKQNNPEMATWYDHIAAVPPMDMEPTMVSEKAHDSS
jgi:hypothetical protein